MPSPTGPATSQVDGEAEQDADDDDQQADEVVAVRVDGAAHGGGPRRRGPRRAPSRRGGTGRLRGLLGGGLLVAGRRAAGHGRYRTNGARERSGITARWWTSAARRGRCSQAHRWPGARVGRLRAEDLAVRTEQDEEVAAEVRRHRGDQLGAPGGRLHREGHHPGLGQLVLDAGQHPGGVEGHVGGGERRDAGGQRRGRPLGRRVETTVVVHPGRLRAGWVDHEQVHLARRGVDLRVALAAPECGLDRLRPRGDLVELDRRGPRRVRGPRARAGRAGSAGRQGRRQHHGEQEDERHAARPHARLRPP